MFSFTKVLTKMLQQIITGRDIVMTGLKYANKQINKKTTTSAFETKSTPYIITVIISLYNNN